MFMETRPSTGPGSTRPYWSEGAGESAHQKLDRNLECDVVIVGGGITGLTAAYLLTRAGKSVILLERARLAQGDTGYTTAHLTMVTDERLSNLVRRFGRSHGQAVWDAGLAAISQIDTIVRHHGIACDFEWVDGYLHSPLNGSEDETAAFEEDAALAVELGFDAEVVARVPLVDRPGIRFAGQARFHPRKYLAHLARTIESQGGRIYESSPVDAFADHPRHVRANGHTVAADHLLIATHNPLAGVQGVASAALFQTKLALYASYVVAGEVPKGAVPDALYWDTADPYHYLRLQPGGERDMVIFGGADHKTGQETDTTTCYAELERTLAALIPGINVTERWSGQVIETPDGLPYIGATAENQHVATGFAGNGMTFGTLGAMMTADAILGRPNPWAELFEPGRKALGRGLWEYVKENADYPYYMMRSRFAGDEGRTLRSIPRGHGAVIEENGTKLAVYRDADGATQVRSATCTHMGCIVAWNAAERTWDCPCHGSRFKPTGEVMAGPAKSPLAEAAVPALKR
jgi:glycine/D-amino acid oxidase-like deaminating enzyme/nitrite reductase/ring-hydroxylating ferredoxin subunit